MMLDDDVGRNWLILVKMNNYIQNDQMLTFLYHLLYNQNYYVVYFKKKKIINYTIIYKIIIIIIISLVYLLKYLKNKIINKKF